MNLKVTLGIVGIATVAGAIYWFTQPTMPESIPQMAQEIQQYSRNLWSGLPAGNTSMSTCADLTGQENRKQKVTDPRLNYAVLWDSFYSSSKQRCLGAIDGSSYDGSVYLTEIVDLDTHAIIVSCTKTVSSKVVSTLTETVNGVKTTVPGHPVAIVCADIDRNSWNYDSQHRTLPLSYPVFVVQGDTSPNVWNDLKNLAQ